jgi:epoxyqueuosine reductase
MAEACGFELAGVARAAPAEGRGRYRAWVEAGFAGEMGYLTDRRAAMRDDPRTLLPAAHSVIAVGKLYNAPQPYSTEFDDVELAWIARYAWSEDYHRVLRRGLRALETMLRERCGAGFESRICVDTAPVVEREYARQAGLGWIGKNTCLINQARGSWFVLGELLVSIEIAPDAPPPDRCGSCRRCIEACPTQAIVPLGVRYAIDSRLCISYLTIELRGSIAEDRRAGNGANVFGCDICQDVCPWNRRAPVVTAFDPRLVAPPLERLAALSEAEFRELFGDTPVWRARYAGFLRNVAVAMGNRGLARFRPALEKLAASEDPMVAGHARWALGKLGGVSSSSSEPRIRSPRPSGT